MTEHINTTWKQIPSDQAMLRTANLLEIIAKAEKRLKRQEKTWSVNEQYGSRVDKKQSAPVPAGN